MHHCVDEFSTLKEFIDKHFANYFVDTPEEAIHLYNIDERLAAPDQLVYWKDSVRIEHFSDTLDNGILYHPDITNEIYAEIVNMLNTNVSTGLMIKGSHGIGKSHSLINVVRKLLSTGENYCDINLDK
jgi:hypothetical protein